jgi:histidine ammonia-lyase
MVKLLQAPFSGLAAGLAAQLATPDDALSELATAGQAITVEARTLAHPVSYELASSVKGEGIEDRATMAPLSARRLVRELVPFTQADGTLPADLEPLVELISRGDLEPLP